MKIRLGLCAVLVLGCVIAGQGRAGRQLSGLGREGQLYALTAVPHWRGRIVEAFDAQWSSSDKSLATVKQGQTLVDDDSGKVIDADEFHAVVRLSIDGADAFVITVTARDPDNHPIVGLFSGVTITAQDAPYTLEMLRSSTWFPH